MALRSALVSGILFAAKVRLTERQTVREGRAQSHWSERVLVQKDSRVVEVDVEHQYIVQGLCPLGYRFFCA